MDLLKNINKVNINFFTRKEFYNEKLIELKKKYNIKD